MGTPEKGMPGLLQCTDGKSTGGHSQISGARARTGMGLAMEVAGGPLFVLVGFSHPGQSLPVAVALLILVLSVTSLQEPVSVRDLVPL